MASDVSSPSSPSALGWAAGFATGAVVGGVAWWVTGQAWLGVVLLAATGMPLGLAFGQLLGERRSTPAERRRTRLFALAGPVLGAAVLASVVLVA